MQKILFGAQGSILRTFCELDIRLRTLGITKSSGYWISDSQFYFHERNRISLLSHPEVIQLLEWNFTSKSKKLIISTKRQQQLENLYNDLGLWDAIIADRRLMYGPVSKVRQCYAGRFNEKELYNIIFNTLDALDSYVAKQRPDAVITFVPATYGDYLLAVVAKKYDTKYLQLRSTKINNYVTFFDSLYAKSSDVEKTYLKNLEQGSGYAFELQAKQYLKDASVQPMDYEGSQSSSIPSAMNQLQNIAKNGIRAIKNAVFPIHPIVRRDNHVPPPIRTWIHGSLLQPWYKREAHRKMSQRLLMPSQPPEDKYLFYPLHSEPEIALSIFGRDHQNQIETIRRLAQSIPLGWKLIVKEHPRSIGYRSNSWYSRILEIPNVYFADPGSRPFYWIKQSQAVVIVSGFVGFEAIAIGKPVIILGDVPYSFLPKNMIRKVESLSSFSTSLSELVNCYKFNPKALNSFVASCMSEGVAVNLYSDILRKSERNKFSAGDASTQIDDLLELLIRKLNVVRSH